MNDIAKAISTYEDRQKAEARIKVEAFAKELGYSLHMVCTINALKLLILRVLCSDPPRKLLFSNLSSRRVITTVGSET